MKGRNGDEEKTGETICLKGPALYMKLVEISYFSNESPRSRQAAVSDASLFRV